RREWPRPGLRRRMDPANDSTVAGSTESPVRRVGDSRALGEPIWFCLVRPPAADPAAADCAGLGGAAALIRDAWWSTVVGGRNADRAHPVVDGCRKLE